MDQYIIRKINVIINFLRHLMKFERSKWIPILFEKHAEYLIILIADNEPELIKHPIF